MDLVVINSCLLSKINTMYVTNDYLTPNKCVKRMHYLQNETQSLLNADNLTSEGAAT